MSALLMIRMQVEGAGAGRRASRKRPRHPTGRLRQVVHKYCVSTFSSAYIWKSWRTAKSATSAAGMRTPSQVL